MTKSYFITATDTDAGKTYVASALICALAKQNYSIAAYKPISAGCNEIVDANNNIQLVNQDALLLQQQANCQQVLSEINPIAFKDPIAPHIAAQKQQQTIQLHTIEQGYQQVLAHNSDIVICEGAGGWRLPLGNGLFLSDFVKRSKQAVILVVNIKLGCLNHALLTYESIINDGLTCVAWVANYPQTTSDELAYCMDNISELKKLLPIPLLANLPRENNINKAAQCFDLSLLKP